MKTLVVVSALVSLAIAAPALSGDGLENTDRTQDRHLQTQSSVPDGLKREKKSPSDITTSSILNSEVQNVHHIEAGDSTPMGRSFSLKKPLIVKKKYGYRLYRDSEEEKAHADSNESCGRQVKVKLCDEDGKFKTSVHENTDIHSSEDDVKHSIKMAKEAVENLQRDLKKIELKTDMKMAHESHSDTELHEDIEVARQALKHIHDNFGNLESMSLHATTTRNSENMHDVHLTIAKTEEERMAQWKEAVENIQKNVEIARNIEDSFKAASTQDSMLHMDQSEAVSTITDKTEENIHSHAALSEVSNMRLSQNKALETHHQEKEAGEETILNKATNEHLGEHNAREEQNTEDDMKTAPSEMIEVHLNNIKSQEALRSENHKIHEHEKSAEANLEEHNVHTENTNLLNKENIVDHQEKSSELGMDTLKDQSENHIMQLPSMKAVEEGTQTKLDVKKDTEFKTSENINLTPTPSDLMKPLTSDAFIEHQRRAEQKVSDDKIEHDLEKEKSADGFTATDDMIDFLAKSVDHLDQDKIEKEDLPKEHVMELAKAAENSKHDMKSKGAVEIEHLDNIPKSAEQLDHTHFHNLAEHDVNVMLAKSADHVSLQDHQNQQMIQQEELSSIENVPEMKAVEEHLHHLQHIHNAHWANENKHLDHLSSVKAAEDFKKELQIAHGQAHEHSMTTEHTMDHLRHSHLPEHSQTPSKMGVSHGFEFASHVQPQTHHFARFHHNPMTQSQLHEISGMDSAMHSNFHPNMRDAMEGFGSDHMLRWKPVHESPRGAYGSGLSSSIGSTSAVGVFPNANTGGCAIPLLLSCSPTVVSGSLAKAHSTGSSYSAPAYRTEDDFGFHNKRDVKKTNDLRTTNTLRTPIVKQKSSIALENKM